MKDLEKSQQRFQGVSYPIVAVFYVPRVVLHCHTAWRYTLPTANLYWLTVEFDPAKLSWEDFRGKARGGGARQVRTQGKFRDGLKARRLVCFGLRPAGD